MRANVYKGVLPLTDQQDIWPIFQFAHVNDDEYHSDANEAKLSSGGLTSPPRTSSSRAPTRSRGRSERRSRPARARPRPHWVAVLGGRFPWAWGRPPVRWSS
eukprot:2171427-Pyramimonas_sp.AAC.1